MISSDHQTPLIFGLPFNERLKDAVSGPVHKSLAFPLDKIDLLKRDVVISGPIHESLKVV